MMKVPRLQVFEVKLPPCPNTRSATVSVVRGLSYSSTRLLSPSATRSVERRVGATPCGEQRLLALMMKVPRLQVFEVKLPPCPNTRPATASVVRGLSYSSTRLLLESAT